MTEDNNDNYEDVSIRDIDIAACNLLANAHYRKFSENFNALNALLNQEMNRMNKLISELISKHDNMSNKLIAAETEISNLKIKHDVLKEEAVKSRNKITELEQQCLSLSAIKNDTINDDMIIDNEYEKPKNRAL